MQQGRTFRIWRGSDGPPHGFARPWLVAAGAIALLLGVGCLVLGSFAGLNPAVAGPVPAPTAPPAGPSDARPLVKNGLTSGQALVSTSVPSSSSATPKNKAKPKAKAKTRRNGSTRSTTTQTSGEDRTSGSEVEADVPDCSLPDGSSDRNHSACPDLSGGGYDDWWASWGQGWGSWGGWGQTQGQQPGSGWGGSGPGQGQSGGGWSGWPGSS